MANKNSLSSSMPFRLLLLVLMANLLLVLMAPTVNSAHLPKKRGKCSVYRPAESEAGNRVKRLTGGTDGDIHQMPWMVYITSNYTYQMPGGGLGNSKTGCTGSLVSRRHVLTAAHCAPVHRMPNSSYMVTVRYGSANLNTPKAVITLPTSSVHVDPLVTPGKIGVDRALIDLGQDLELDETVQPICVACLDNQTFPQGQAYIAGWGNIDPVCSFGNGTWPDVFKCDRVGIHHCIAQGLVDADKVCTDADSTQGIGGGDSGSALLASANDGKTFLQVGVVSTTSCRQDEREDGASKVGKQWFEQITGVKCKKFRANNNNDDCEDED